MNEVENGETLIITRHGRPIARLVPEQEPRSAEISARRLAGFRRAGKARLASLLKKSSPPGTKAENSVFVLDAAIAACWAYPGETDPSASKALALLAADNAVVPALFWLELRNILVVNERRGRVREAETRAFLRDVAALPIRVDTLSDEDEVMRIARTYRLTVYDAAYLELASRHKSPLATLDKQLRRASVLENVPKL